MEGEIDYTQHSESELVEMFGRLDPRRAPAECARLGTFLTEHGYQVTNGTSAPGFAAPSAAKLQALIGSPQPLEWKVDYGGNAQSLGFRPTQNAFGFAGSGTIVTDGIFLWLSGRVSGAGPFHSSMEENTQLPYRQIANVESEGPLVRFGYNVDGDEESDSICLRLADKAAADQLVAILPKRRTKRPRPQVKVDAEFTALKRTPR
jgi:hypothetical protein